MRKFNEALGRNMLGDVEHSAHLLSALIDTSVVQADIKAGGTHGAIDAVSVFDALTLAVVL